MILQPRIGDLMGDLTLHVGAADIRDVSLEIRPIAPQDIAGTIVFLGRTKPGAMAVTLRRSLGDTKSAVSNADGSFVVKDVLPGEYFMDVRNLGGDGVPQTDGWMVAEQLGGRDVFAQMFDIGNDPAGALKISFATTVAKLTGKLLDAAGQPVSGGNIVFLSAEGIRSHGFSKDDGTFTANLLTTGEQRIFVVTPFEEYEAFRDPDFLDAHRNDFPAVQIAEGANAPLVLRVR